MMCVKVQVARPAIVASSNTAESVSPDPEHCLGYRRTWITPGPSSDPGRLLRAVSRPGHGKLRPTSTSGRFQPLPTRASSGNAVGTEEMPLSTIEVRRDRTSRDPPQRFGELGRVRQLGAGTLGYDVEAYRDRRRTCRATWFERRPSPGASERQPVGSPQADGLRAAHDARR